MQLIVILIRVCDDQGSASRVASVGSIARQPNYLESRLESSKVGSAGVEIRVVGVRNTNQHAGRGRVQSHTRKD